MRGDDERLHEINEAWGIGFMQQTACLISGVPNSVTYRREQFVRGRQYAQRLEVDSDCPIVPDECSGESTPV